ncbi:MAG: hypothetical protein IJY28_06130 [Clostridia bacterium]|nr:hypothetical protein [Clostridia bacterium]
MLKKIFSGILSIGYPLLLVVVIGMTFSTQHTGKISFRAEELPTSPKYIVDLNRNTIDCFSSQTYYAHVFQSPVSYKWYQIGPYYRAVFYYPQTRTVAEKWSYKQPPTNHWRVGMYDSPTWAQTAGQLAYCYTELLPARGLAHPIMPALVWLLCVWSLPLGAWMVIHPKSVAAVLVWYWSPDDSSKILPYLFRRAGVLLLICTLLLLHFLIFIFF